MSAKLFSGGIQAQAAPKPLPGELKAQKDGPWLHAWSDKVADLDTFSQCLALGDLNDEGSHALLVANHNKKLKVFKGNGLYTMQPLLETPAGVVTFYPDSNTPRIPSVAVAAGPSIYIYRNLRPYYKFSLPQMPVNETEAAVWGNLKQKTLPVPDALQRLRDEKRSGGSLTPRSLMLLSIVDPAERDDFVDLHRLLPLKSMVKFI